MAKNSDSRDAKSPVPANGHRGPIERDAVTGRSFDRVNTNRNSRIDKNEKVALDTKELCITKTK